MKKISRTTKTRIMSGLLSLAMIISLFPASSVYADDIQIVDTTTTDTTETIVDLNEEVVEIIDADENINSIPENEDVDDQEVVNEDNKPPQTDETGTTESTIENTESTTSTEDVTTEATTTESTTESVIDATTEVIEIVGDTASNTDATTTTESTTEVTTEEIVEEEPEVALITFDHYFSEIDDSLVTTTDLLVQTSDPSIFTKNTNVVSNHEDMYVISCESVEQARYVYSYYVDKVDHIIDMANVISIATNDTETTEPSTETTEANTTTSETTTEETVVEVQSPEDVADLSDVNTSSDDAIANLDEMSTNNYNGYIALIDTGANADINLSVVGDDPSDHNGHGTKMLQCIKEENPNAKVISIKVFDDSSLTSVANVYAGIRLAIDSNVSIINLSFVGPNIEQNAIIQEVINEALSKGITVIGAAGNANSDATYYIPGCIDGVISVGAVNEDGTLYKSSNFNADKYVIATSTSEAAARYSGIYSANINSDKVFDKINKTNTHSDKKVA